MISFGEKLKVKAANTNTPMKSFVLIVTPAMGPVEEIPRGLRLLSKTGPINGGDTKR